MKCYNCQSDALVSLSSIDKRLCVDCGHYNEWQLKPQQKSVLIEGKVGCEKENPLRRNK